ncbi:MAG: DUF4116 domain-containing protein [Romboutsia sp.]|nr:DUF4116 domain-containing protein [Romboutsia sp.]
MNYIENIKKDGLYLRHIYKKEQTKEMCLAALNQNIESYEFIAVRLLDKDILSFIISNGINQDKSNQKKLKKLYNAIIDLGRKARKTEDLYYLNEEFFIKAVELDYRMLLFIPDEKQTYQMCFDLVKENPNALLYINTDYMTEELCIEVIKKDGNAIEFIPSDKLNENICLNALEQNWEAIEYISKENQTEKVCMKAIDECYISIRYIDEEILNKLDLTKYCFCMERKDISRINDERIKKLKI